MTVPVTVSERDLAALLGIVTDHRGADPGDGLPLSLLHQLMAQVPSEAVSFFGLDSRQQTIWFGQSVPANDGDDADVFWAHYWDCLPCSYPDRTGDARSVTRISDFYSARQWHAKATVRKHLENIYSRLRVSSRTAAVTRAFAAAPPHGPGPMPN